MYTTGLFLLFVLSNELLSNYNILILSIECLNDQFNSNIWNESNIQKQQLKYQ